MRDILIMTVGQAPPIVTETVWALLSRKPQPFRPEAVHLVTTTRGERDFGERGLLGEAGYLARLFRQFGHEPVAPRVDVPPLADGRRIDDIRAQAECIAFADFITELIMSYAGDPDTRIHVSLAGGRKTMSYLAGAALSLVGRPQDELSHVLVYPEALERADFWWPGCGTAEGAAAGRVEMALLPFVRLGGSVDPVEIFGGARPDFAGVVAAAQRAIGVKGLVLDCLRRTLRIADRKVQLAPRSFALYRLCARALVERWPGVGAGGVGDLHAGWLTMEMLQSDRVKPILKEFYDDCFSAGTLSKTEPATERADFQRLLDGPPDQLAASVSQAMSRCNRRLREALRDAVLYNRFRIHTLPTVEPVGAGKRRFNRFGLMLEPAQIGETWR